MGERPDKELLFSPTPLGRGGDRAAWQLFAEGGSGAAAAAAGQTGAPGQSDGQSEEGRDAAAPQRQTAKTPGEHAAASGQDKAAEFERLIRGEYKEQFAARTQRLIGQRFKAERSAQAELARLTQRQSQSQSQSRAGETPTESPDGQAQEKVQQLLEQLRQRRAEQISAQWQRDAQALQQVYPGFSLEGELHSPAFVRLMKAGVPVRTAYEACHLQEILGGAMQYTADKVAQGVALRQASRAGRPPENGVTAQAGAVMPPDVNGLSRAQREEIERRVAKGEHIRF